MKKIFTIITLNCLLACCAFGQTEENFQGKVINRTDINRLKQGLWVYFYDTLHTKVSATGNFVNDRREGVWTEYHSNGKMRSEMNYVSNEIDGHVKIYYENGKVSEEGIWHDSHWVGEYKYFYESGQLLYSWFFDETGNRSGRQEYFHENGQLMASGNWVAGHKDGTIVQYYDSGKLRSESQWKNDNVHGLTKEFYGSGALKAELIYNNGVYDAVASKTYRDKVKPVVVEPPKPDTTDIQIVQPPIPDQLIVETSDTPDMFSGNGHYKLLTLDKKIDREGDFVNGQLINGKRYYYNASGKLVRIAIYEHGRIVKIEDKE